MTFPTQDHIHIWKVGATYNHSTTLYRVAAGGVSDIPKPIASHVRALNSTPHLHVLADNSGNPVLINDAQINMWVTQEELDALKLLQGTKCYYLPIRHMADNEDHIDGTTHVPCDPGYRVSMMPLQNERQVDPMLTYWMISLDLKDDE